MDEIPTFCLTLKISSLEEIVFATLSQDKNLWLGLSEASKGDYLLQM